MSLTLAGHVAIRVYVCVCVYYLSRLYYAYLDINALSNVYTHARIYRNVYIHLGFVNTYIHANEHIHMNRVCRNTWAYVNTGLMAPGEHIHVHLTHPPTC